MSLVPLPLILLRGKLQPMGLVGALVMQLWLRPHTMEKGGCIKTIGKSGKFFFCVLRAEWSSPNETADVPSNSQVH